MELLEHQRLIYSQRVGELGECGLAVESSTEEWDKQGRLFTFSVTVLWMGNLDE